MRSRIGRTLVALTLAAPLIAIVAPATPSALAAPTCELGNEIQHVVFEVGKRHPFESLRHWFQALYETLLGSSQGPRMGSFIALYGIDNSRRLIAEALAN